MDEDIKQNIRKKRGVPRKIFAKNTDAQQNQEPEKSTQNVNSMETPNTGGNNEFLNDIGSENEKRTTAPPVTEVTSTMSSTPTSDTGIKTDAAFVDDGDAKSKATIDPLLAEDVAHKSYAKGLTDTSNIPTGDIPEAKFVMPKNIIDDSPPAQTQQIPKAEPIQPLNKDAETLSPAEKRAGAQLSVEAFWTGWDKVNMLLGKWLQFPMDKRIKMHHADELDLNMKVRVSVDGTQITINEFYEQLNKDIEEVFTTDPKLKERLYEPMVREAEKLGLVMTDRQFIIKELGQEVITKVVQVVSIKSSLNSFTKQMKETYAEQKKAEEEKKKEEKVAEEKRARMIDPDTDEGMATIHDWYKKLRDLEDDGVRRAARMSEEFKKTPEGVYEEKEETPAPTPKVNVVVEEQSKKEAPASTSTEIVVAVEEVKDEKE